MRFLFVCGGTAGHINPALAVAEKLKVLRPDSEIMFIGANRELEKKLVPAAGYELRNITVTGFSRSFSPAGLKHNIDMVRDLRASFKESAGMLSEFRPDAVIGTGGYVCYPVITKAREMGIRTFLHESNAVPGLAAKLLSGKVDKMFTAFPGTSGEYRRPDKVLCVGTPVRRTFFNTSRLAAKARLGLPDMPLVVSFWGSLGAGEMNRIMTDVIRMNTLENGFYHIHATGNGDRGKQRFIQNLREKGVIKPAHTDIRPYIDNMGEVMAAADVIVCRAGASTIAELTLMGRASILVPSPNVTNDHQTKNARAVEKVGGGILIPESECTPEKLYNEITVLVRHPQVRERMERACAGLGVRDSADRICKEIFSVIGVD